MKEKFCTTCQQHRNAENGEFVLRGGIKRWLCIECQTRRSESFINRQKPKVKKEKRNGLGGGNYEERN
jgi:hypothetical protein